MNFYSMMLVIGFLAVIIDVFIGSFVVMGLGFAAILTGAIGWALMLELPFVAGIFITCSVIFTYFVLRLRDQETIGTTIGQQLNEAEKGNIIPVISHQPFKVTYRGVPYDAKTEHGAIDAQCQYVRVVREEGLFVVVETIQEESSYV